MAAALSAPIALPGVKASSRTTFGAIVAAGFDPEKIIAGFYASPSGQALIGKLNADDAGVDWSDELTRFVVGRIVAAGGDVTAEVAAVLVGLSARSTTLAGVVVTAERCQADWVAGLAAEAEAAAIEAVRQRNEAWGERFYAALNTLGTFEAGAGVAAVRLIADEMEA